MTCIVHKIRETWQSVKKVHKLFHRTNGLTVAVKNLHLSGVGESSMRDNLHAHAVLKRGDNVSCQKVKELTIGHVILGSSTYSFQKKKKETIMFGSPTLSYFLISFFQRNFFIGKIVLKDLFCVHAFFCLTLDIICLHYQLYKIQPQFLLIWKSWLLQIN